VKLKLPVGSFKAYLFDCDGTIVDSMPLHYIAWSKALSEWSSKKLLRAYGIKTTTDELCTSAKAAATASGDRAEFTGVPEPPVPVTALVTRIGRRSFQ